MRDSVQEAEPDNRPDDVLAPHQPKPNLAVFARSVYEAETPRGYMLVSDFDGVAVYRTESANHKPRYVIAHRGTDNFGDLATDLLLAVGKKGPVFSERKRMTIESIRAIRQLHPDAKIHLTGHSLGGATVNHTMFDPYVQSQVEDAETYNVGSSPFFDNDLAPNVTSNVTFGDVVSMSSAVSNPDTEVSVVKPVGFVPSAVNLVRNILNAHTIDHFL